MSVSVTLPPFPDFCRDVLGLDVSTRGPVLAFMAAFDGDVLSPEQAAILERYTGRPYVHRPGGYRQAVLQVGRQAGKSEMAAARTVYLAAKAVLEGRRNRWFAAVAQDHRAGQRALFGHIKRFCERPLIAPLVTRITADTIVWEGNNTSAVFPCRPPSWRGLAIDEFDMDEPAHYRSSENIPLDRECWRSALPALAMTGGKLLALSSPYIASGLLYELHRKHYGRPDSDLLFWVSPSTALNPKLDTAFLEHLRDVDAEGARAEIDGEFLENTSALLDEETLRAAVDADVLVRSREPGISYSAFMDWATGSKAGNDAATIAIGHRRRDGKAVLDALQAWAPPFSPSQVAIEASSLCARYGVDTVTGDRFAQGFSDEALRRAGLTYRHSEMDKSALYLAFAAGVNAGEVRLLDEPELLRELRGLERRRTPTKDRVDHRPGARDDRANSAAGIISLLLRVQRGGSGEMTAWWL